MSVLRLSRLFFVLAVVGMAALLLLSTPRATAYSSRPSAAPFGVAQAGEGETGPLQRGVAATEPHNVEFVGQVGGMIHAVAISGTYAYVGIGPRVAVFDIHDPAQPQLVWQSEIVPPALPRQGGEVAVHGNRLYAALGGRFIIFDLTNPANPVEVASSTVPLWDFVVSGHYVYGFNQGLQIYDVSNPAAPVLVGSYHLEDVYQFAVAGNYAYLGGTRPDGRNGVFILDVSDPSSPAQVAFYHTEGPPDDLAVNGEHLYILNPSGTPNLVIVDVSVPANPRLAGSLSSPGCQPHALSVSGNYAYVAGINVLCILDISDPASPEKVAHLPLPDDGRKITVAGDYAYIIDSFTGMRIVDVSQPDAPEVGEAIYSPSWARDLVITGTHAYLVARRLFILDVSDPNAPSQEAVHDANGYLMSVNVTGKYAYVSPTVSGIEILDVSDPATPALVGSHPVGARDIAISGTHAYVTTGWDELVTLDVSNPVSPTFASSFPINGPSEKVKVAGERAYVTDGQGYRGNPPSFSVLDITNPDAPAYAGGLPIGGQDFDVVGDYVYLAHTFTLSIWDFSDPAAPTRVGSIPLPDSGQLEAVEVVGDYAYVAASSAGLRVVNVANPANPCHVGSFPSEYALDVAVSGGHIYLADAFAGLLVLRHDTPNAGFPCSVLYLPLLHNR